MLNNRIKTAQVIAEFLAEKGIDPKSILPSQYSQIGGPIRVILVKRLFGSWSRAMTFVQKHMPEEKPKEKPPEEKPPEKKPADKKPPAKEVVEPKPDGEV